VSLQSANRPLGSFIFAGPTGVGKTELAKALASFLFGSTEALIRLDMSEFMEAHTISKLIGSPPGFVGYDEGGQLTQAVRSRPYSVILLDEIEKAHPDIFNLFLQVLDDGRLTDSQGRVVNFQNTLIIMTSNLGSSVIEKGGSSLGFSLSASSDDYSQLSKRVMEDFKQYFRPEFLNRLDEVIVFRRLQRDEIAQIADLLLAQVASQIAEQRQIVLEFSTAFRDLIADEGYSPAWGARPLRRAISNRLEDSLAEAILQGSIKDNSTVFVDLDEQGYVLLSPLKQPVLDYQTVG
jgi:ATP-dependent Clp protease ATP-binding subunit ClpC